MSRPEVTIDWKKVDELMIAGCLGTEVAAYFGIHPNTFYRRVEEHFDMSFSDYSSEKKSHGESLIRAAQYAKALGLSDKGDNTLLIWLGKNRLGQRDADKIVVQKHDEEKLDQATTLVTYLQEKKNEKEKS